MTLRYFGFVGENLNYYTPDQAFINRLKLFSGWAGRHASFPAGFGEECINLDSDGYPLNLSGKTGSAAEGLTFSQVDTGGLVAQTPIFGENSKQVGGADGGTHHPPDSATVAAYTPDQYYPEGAWVLLYDGEATITVTGGDITTNSTAAGRIDFTINSSDGGGLHVNVTSINGANHCRNMRLVPAAEESLLEDDGEIFAPDWLDFCGPARVFRFMKWYDVDGTDNSTLQNGSSIQEWDDRKALSNMIYGGGPPPEIPIAMVNRLSQDRPAGAGTIPWICHPFCVSDDYIESFATLAHDTLDMTKIPFVIVEHGNEPWLNISPTNARVMVERGYELFPDTKNTFGTFTGSISGTTLTVSDWTDVTGNPLQALNFKGHLIIGGVVDMDLTIDAFVSGVNGGDGVYTISKDMGTVSSTAMSQGGSFPAHSMYSTSRTVRTRQIWREVWGADADLVKVGFGGQGGSGDFFTNGSLATTAGAAGSDDGPDGPWGGMTGAVGDNIDALFTNGYFNPISMPSGCTVDDIFDNINTVGLPGLITQWDIDTASAAVYGIPIYVYEAGPNMSDTIVAVPENWPTYAAANYDPRMGNAVTDMFNLMKAYSIDVCIYYSALGGYGQYGNWGMKENMYQPTTPKYAAFLEFASGRNYSTAHVTVSE